MFNPLPYLSYMEEENVLSFQEYECYPICDLRSALAAIEKIPGQLLQTDVPVNPDADLAGVYKLIGAGGTVERTTRSYHVIQQYPGIYGCKGFGRIDGQPRKGSYIAAGPGCRTGYSPRKGHC